MTLTDKGTAVVGGSSGGVDSGPVCVVGIVVGCTIIGGTASTGGESGAVVNAGTVVFFSDVVNGAVDNDADGLGRFMMDK